MTQSYRNHPRQKIIQRIKISKGYQSIWAPIQMSDDTGYKENTNHRISLNGDRMKKSCHRENEKF